MEKVEDEGESFRPEPERECEKEGEAGGVAEEV